MTVPVPFATNSYQSRSLPLSAQDCKNLFAEKAPADAKSQIVLFGTPGLTQFTTAGSGPIRLLYEMAGSLYAVSKDQLYSISSSGTATLIGTLAGPERTDYRIDAADNGTQLVLVNSGTGWASVYNRSTNTLSAITDQDFPRASSVTYVDGYHVFTRPSTGQFFISDLLEATAFDALDFATAEIYPDFLVRAFVDHRELWLFGDQSVEIWANVGAADFPFQRLSGTVIEKGCAAGGSVAKLDNSLFWLGHDRVIYRAAGYQPQRVSTHAIEYAMEGYGTVSDAMAFAHTMEGHSFYTLTFPSVPVTWVYDGSTGLWHRRESRDSIGRGIGRWRVNSYARCYGRQLAGDFESNKIYTLSLDAFTEDGTPLARVAVSPPLQAMGDRMFMPRVDLIVETGVGLSTGQGSDPQAMLQWSDDGGRSWSNEHWATLGAVGAYRRHARWYRCGSFDERYLRLTISDPVRIAILGASAELTKGWPAP
jgi:Phage stabilisation protein